MIQSLLIRLCAHYLLCNFLCKVLKRPFSLQPCGKLLHPPSKGSHEKRIAAL